MAQAYLANNPITAYRQRRADDAARNQRAARLQRGDEMTLLSPRANVPVKVALTADNSMLTWQSIGNQATASGVASLAIVREVKPVTKGGFMQSSAEIPLQWTVVTDDEKVIFEAPSETLKELWIDTLLELAKRQAEGKRSRKNTYVSKRVEGLEERKREAEKRKAAILATCSSGGMQHTAAAMMSRN